MCARTAVVCGEPSPRHRYSESSEAKARFTDAGRNPRSTIKNRA